MGSSPTHPATFRKDIGMYNSEEKLEVVIKYLRNYAHLFTEAVSNAKRHQSNNGDGTVIIMKVGPLCKFTSQLMELAKWLEEE